MTCFVECNNLAFLFVFAACLFLKTNTYLINCIIEICHGNLFPAVAYGKDCSFIYNVCKICSSKTCSSVCKRSKVNITVKLNILCMDAENCFTTGYIRLFYRNLTVKTSWTQNCRVKNVNTVCSGKHYKSFFVIKTIHFYKKLV